MNFRAFWNELKHYPSAIAGLAVIILFVSIAIYAMFAMPPWHASELWRGGDRVWRASPRNARPIWFNALPWHNEPVTEVLSTVESPELKEVEATSATQTEKRIRFTFDYPYDGFPRELSLFFTSEYEERRPFVRVRWNTPDGRSFVIADQAIRRSESIRIDQEDRVRRRVGGVHPRIGLFSDPEFEEPRPLKGEYEVVIEGYTFEDESTIEATFVRYGQVHGIAGTDHRRRNIGVALLAGTPIALSFGLIAAVGSSITTLIIAAWGVWFGGFRDAAVQRITELNLILPILPILVMIGTFYSRSLWVMLTAVVLLSIFSAGVKTYRAMLLQVKELPYIEAARAYGAGDLRIIFRYLIPKVLPTLVPGFVTVIPTFVFLEATLALLGLGDPILPTWGKVLEDAYQNGALYNGYYYWVLLPSGLLIFSGLGFAMFGFALDRIFNPRLRGM